MVARFDSWHARVLKFAAVAGGVLLVVPVAPPASAAPAPDGFGGHRLELDVLSSRADQVSGGDALIAVRLGPRIDPDEVRVTLNGADVTGVFGADWTGLVNGLRLGVNVLRATAGRGRGVSLLVRNHPVAGPIFSGPKQYPFLCRTEQAGLGQPIVDNQAGHGMRVFARDANGRQTTQVVGWSRDCAASRVVDRLYRASDGTFKPMPADGSRPADLTSTVTLDGSTVDYIVERERGTINRFVYAISRLADPTGWNRRAIFHFDGGVAIGHDQGRLPGGHLYHEGLSRGYAVLYSTGTRTNTHYNLVLGGETALMVKERFIERYGVPLYTVGVGGSGGGIQQYVYGQNYGTRTWSPRRSTWGTASCSSTTWTSPTRRTRSGVTGRTAPG